MTITFTEAQTESRRVLDESTARFWTADDIKAWINEAVKDIARRTETIQTKNEAFAVVAGTATYTLPNNMHRLHKVEFVATGSSQVYPVSLATIDEMESVWGLNKTRAGSYPQFAILWGFVPNLEIRLFPVPNVNGVLNLYYYKIPAKLVNANDVVELPEGWETLIYDYVEFRALRKDRDPRWSEAKALYESSLGTMAEMLRQLHDQQQFITTASGSSVPRWVYDFDYDG